jgi:hypothetical protein
VHNIEGFDENITVSRTILEFDDLGTAFQQGERPLHCFVCGAFLTEYNHVRCDCNHNCCASHAVRTEDGRTICSHCNRPGDIGYSIAFVLLVLFALYVFSLLI